MQKLQNHKLPVYRLDQLVQYRKGKKPSNYVNAGTKNAIPYIDIKAFEQNIVTKYTTDTDAPSTTKDDVLVVWDGARFGLTGKSSGVVGSTLMRLTPSEAIDTDFLLYFIKSQYHIVSANPRGTGIPHVNPDIFWNLRIKLPKIEDQKEIILKIKKLTEKVNVTNDCIASVKNCLQQFRQSVLSAAVTGKLTEEWRESKSRDFNWNTVELSEVIQEKPRNGLSPRSVSYKTPVKVLTLTATTSGTFNPNYFKYVANKIENNSYLWLEPGDILIQRGNTIEYVGVSAVYQGNKHEFIFPDLMMRIRANSKIDTWFLYYVLSSQSVRSYFRNNATGTSGNMPKINQPTVMGAEIVLPELDEQQEIVKRVRLLFSLADNFEGQIEQVRSKAEKLTQSILAKAFRGKL